MILYTPMQLELVLEGLEEMKSVDYRKTSYDGVPLLVEHTDAGKRRIVRILSTDPRDYLRENLQPGKFI